MTHIDEHTWAQGRPPPTSEAGDVTHRDTGWPAHSHRAGRQQTWDPNPHLIPELCPQPPDTLMVT